jgi:hypothetical protein
VNVLYERPRLEGQERETMDTEARLPPCTGIGKTRRIAINDGARPTQEVPSSLIGWPSALTFINEDGNFGLSSEIQSHESPPIHDYREDEKGFLCAFPCFFQLIYVLACF